VLLDLLVQANVDPRRVVPVAADLGRHHTRAHVHEPHYHTTGVALLRALERVLGGAFTSDVRAVWAEAFALVSALMERSAGRTSEHPAT
jgi:nitric oxide dioxygenase